MNETLVRLAPAAQVFVRPGPAIQFGIDATRAGVIDFIDREHLPGVMRGLLRAREEISWAALKKELVAAGLRVSIAETLLEELLTYRVLIFSGIRTPNIYVLGHGALAAAITDGLDSCGFRVQPALAGEPDEDFLQRCNPDSPLIVTDRLSHSRRLAPRLVQQLGPVIPVSLIDGRGIIGPLRIGGVGPCPLCMDLHRIEVDRSWPTLLAQAAAARGGFDPMAAHATVAKVLPMMGALVRPGMEPPGAHRLSLNPGDMFEVDPFDLSTQVRRYPEHPGCPACWK